MSTTASGSNTVVTLTFSCTDVGAGLVFYKNNTDVVAIEYVWNNASILQAPIVNATTSSFSASLSVPTSWGTPIQVRHLWRDRPCEYYNPDGANCQIYNSYGLPMPPFVYTLGCEKDALCN